MNQVKSPGQKRKTRVKIISLLIGVALLAAGVWVKSIYSRGAIKLLKNHEVAEAIITDLKYKEIRTKKRNTKDMYYLSYNFDAEGANWENTDMISYQEYESLEGKESIEVFYAKNNPRINATETSLKSDAATPNFMHVFSVGIWVVPGTYFLYLLISLIFVREPKGVLTEGFYTENSWLDVDDNYLIFLQGAQILIFQFNKKQSSKVQKYYQEGKGLEITQLVEGVTSSIDLDKVTAVESRHYSDALSVTHEQVDKDNKDKMEEVTTSVEFISAATKEHALGYITPLLPTTLKENLQRQTRIRSSVTGLIWSILAGGLVLYFDANVIAIVAAFIILYFALPSFFARLLDPAVITTWKAATASGVEKV